VHEPPGRGPKWGTRCRFETWEQTDRHTDMLIAICLPRTRIRGRRSNRSVIATLKCIENRPREAGAGGKDAEVQTWHRSTEQMKPAATAEPESTPSLRVCGPAPAARPIILGLYRCPNIIGRAVGAGQAYR